jgi:predicted nucleotidyltransferase component of viral defense system
MLSFDQIKKIYPENILIRNPKAVLVEYVQHEILDSIYKQSGSENLSFMGGTAIRVIYNGKRFSEDLDFDNFGLSFLQFKQLLEKVVVDMSAKGFDLEFKFIEKGAYHCYIKFPKLLQESNLAVHKEEKLLVRIDTVRKKKQIKPEIIILDKFDVYRKILVNPVDIILSQKFAAILGRKREKGRDFYDVSFLLAKTNPNYEYLEKVHKIKKTDLKKIILKKIESLNFKQLTEDVLPFLQEPSDKERILTFKEYIINKL